MSGLSALIILYMYVTFKNCIFEFNFTCIGQKLKCTELSISMVVHSVGLLNVVDWFVVKVYYSYFTCVRVHAQKVKDTDSKKVLLI